MSAHERRRLVRPSRDSAADIKTTMLRFSTSFLLLLALCAYARAQTPRTALEFQTRGDARLEQGDHRGAAEDYTQALKLNPPDAAALHLKRGAARIRDDDADGALADFDAAVRLQPGNADAFFQRSLVRDAKGEAEAALSDLNKAISLAPDRPDFYLRRGLRNLGRALEPEEIDAALSDLDKAVALDPKNPLGYFVRGSARMLRDDFAGALADHDKAVELDPSNAALYGSRAHLKVAFLGDNEGAVADASKAIELGGDEYAYEAYATRGVARQALGRKAEAERDFSKCVELDARCRKSLDRLSMLLERMKARGKVN